ncbi:MAG: hypothetical protein JKX75_08130 [Gammaproteobacteria bacterium]|nr:hypothetical protein [Gammaproteobacteria bacterium]
MKRLPLLPRTILLITLFLIKPVFLFAALSETHISVDNNSATTVSEQYIATDASLVAVLAAENNGQLMKALSLTKTLFKNDQGHMLTRIYYGRLLVKTGKSKQAIVVLQPLARESTQDWRPWFWLGTAQLLEGELDNAAFSLDEALAREGDVISLWVQRAIVEQERGEPVVALHLLQVADAIVPGNTDVMINYAYASELSGDIKKAEYMYKRFLQLTASTPKYGRLRSYIFYRLSQFVKANKETVALDDK